MNKNTKTPQKKVPTPSPQKKTQVPQKNTKSLQNPDTKTPQKPTPQKPGSRNQKVSKVATINSDADFDISIVKSTNNRINTNNKDES